MKQTFKTYHPTIKEISIGDQFVTYGGEIVEFMYYRPNNIGYPYIFKPYGGYHYNLKYNERWASKKDIEFKILSLKEKINHI